MAVYTGCECRLGSRYGALVRGLLNGQSYNRATLYYKFRARFTLKEKMTDSS